MRQFMTDLHNQQSAVIRCLRPDFRRTASLLAVASVLGLASAGADDAAGVGVKSKDKGPVVRAKSEAEPVAIPECLEKLKLSTQQQTQIKEIIGNCDNSLATVWKQFGDRYMQAITMESSLLAAIEDNLTEAQRQQVRAQRHRTARDEKATEATNEKPNRSAVVPASAVEDDLAGVGVTLSSEQEAAADKIQEKYRSHLRALKRDIQGLHIRLVSLEADKLVAIEKVLTKEQLTELRSHRQNAPELPKVTTSRIEPTKTE